ncbi:MAG: hypothetical protein BWX56_01377 [Euryarchaeota archaeon ADurb.Bin023]|jgi:isoprenylcysteine carboxyl methyltransferase (ICMT) family protein YpbQ|nr:MAG: hypothetical protein BWX56_01377 [Euryarchaeota archaeon ADurb.Bin023]
MLLIVIMALMDKITTIEPIETQPKPITRSNNNYYLYCCIGIFVSFIIMIILFSFLNISDWLKFSVIMFGVFILVDIHHTLKKIWTMQVL